MRLWRLSRHASLDGAGGLRVNGRWHTRGQPILYCAPNPATAVLEQLVQQEIRRPEALQGYRLLEIDLPEDTRIERIDIAHLPESWPQDLNRTRRLGDNWLRLGHVAVLEVPSAIVPATYNLVVNPQHADARRLRLLADQAFVFDPRLVHR